MGIIREVPSALAWLAAIITLMAIAGGMAMGSGGGDQQMPGEQDYCNVCHMHKSVFKLTRCGLPICNFCLPDFLRENHTCAAAGLTAGWILTLENQKPENLSLGEDIKQPNYQHVLEYPPWFFSSVAKKNGRLHLFYYNIHDLEQRRQPTVTEVIHVVGTDQKLSQAIVTPPSSRRRPFSEL